MAGVYRPGTLTGDTMGGDNGSEGDGLNQIRTGPGQALARGLAVVAVASLATYGLVGLFPKTYESRLSLFFPAATGGSVGGNVIVPGLGGKSEGDVSSFPGAVGSGTPVVGSSPATAEGLMKSEKCRRFVVAKVGLDKKWGLTPVRAAKELAGRVRVRVDDNRFLALSAQAESPELAKEIASAHEAFLSGEASGLTLNIGKRNRAMLERRLEAIQASVEEALAQLVDTASDHPAVDAEGIRSVVADGTRQLAAARAAESAAAEKLASYKRRVERALAAGDANSLRAAGAGEDLVELAKTLQSRRLELADAQKRFTESSEELREARRRAEAVEAQVRSASERGRRQLAGGVYAPLISPEAELEGLRATVREYEKALSSAVALGRRAPEDAARVQAAQRRYESVVGLREALLVQLEYARLAEDRDPARYEVVDEPYADDQHVAPRRGLITGGVAAAGVAVVAWLALRRRVSWVA
jgi:uncharacterized protein involved in exopolysaccharide biosynthesis